MEQPLKLYIWSCSITDSGSLMVLARTVREARALVRADPGYARAKANFEHALRERPLVSRGPQVVAA